MKFCLGTVQFGLDYGIEGNGQPDIEKTFEMLTYAIDHSIDALDTASAYGEAETVLGEYFKRFPEKRNYVKVVSKLKPNAFDDQEDQKWSVIAIDNARASVEKIGVDQLWAYLFHNASYIFNENAVQAIDAVKESGIAKRIGVSIYSPEEAMKALEYPEISVIQIPYNVLDNRLDQVGFFRKAKDQDVTIFARSSLLQGLLMMDPENLPARVSFAKDYLSEFNRICEKNSLSSLQAAIGYVGQKEEIDYVVFGVDNLAQLKEYVELMNVNIPEAAINSFRDAFSNVEERLVNPSLWK